MRRYLRPSWLLAWLAAPIAAMADQPAATTQTYDALKRADRFVLASDRYLHHSRLKEGMTGYGLTVMQGTRIDRFDVTIVSVMKNYTPQHDVIICRLSGLGLEKGGIIAGMSGSPVYVKDPADGKDKLIGAVAYGWSFQKEPVCGIQPIAHMLAVEGVPLPGAPPPATQPAGAAVKAAALDEDFVKTVLQPGKPDLAALLSGKPKARTAAGAGSSSLAPLGVPVMTSSGGRRAYGLAEDALSGGSMMAVQSGSAMGAATEAAGQVKLQPGSGIAIPLVTGDGSWTALGTVTEVIGDYVLALGHAFQAEGAVEFPMGPAYVHTVITSVGRSFKLGSSLGVTGTLTCDELTAVGGRVGQKSQWVPMDVVVRRGQARQQYHYDIARHRIATGSLAGMFLEDSVLAARDLPELHTLEYSIDIEFAGLPAYRVSNLSAGSDMSQARSDLVRPMLALMNTALGQPVTPKSIRVTVDVLPVRKTAKILWLKLDQNACKPGQTVRGQVTVQPFRAERATVEVSLRLPEDLRDGRYVLTACAAEGALEAMQEEMPHRFLPRTVEALYQAMQQIVATRTDRLYLRLPLPVSGVAVRQNELDRIPLSVAELLLRSGPADARLYRQSLTADFASEYVLSGSAVAEITVEREPK